MITSDKISFKASKYAPNFREVEYWIDLNEGPDGQIIKCYSKGKWVPINYKQNEDQSQAISELKANKVDKSTYNQFVQDNNNQHEQFTNEIQQISTSNEQNSQSIEQINQKIETKADKSTTLSGYGIVDAYTKTEIDSKINEKVTQLISSAPETLDTLDELAAALGDDPNFATTVSNLIGTKANSSEVYSKSEVYNKTETNSAISTAITNSNRVESTDIKSIVIVDTIPDVQEEGVLYIKLETTSESEDPLG